MKYERITEKELSICTWESPKPIVKIKHLPLLFINSNAYDTQEQANLRLKYLEDLIEQEKLIELPIKGSFTKEQLDNYVDKGEANND